jgi:hypothetical protein
MLVRISLGRTINLGNFQSLRVDVAHEVDVAAHPDRAAAVAEAVRLCRADLARLLEEEGGGGRDDDEVARLRAEVARLRAAVAQSLALARGTGDAESRLAAVLNDLDELDDDGIDF